MFSRDDIEKTDLTRGWEGVKSVAKQQTIIVQKHCWTKIFGWCRAAKSEVSGWGLVRMTERGLEVYDVFLPAQRCSSGYTELDDHATGKLINRIFKTGRKPEELRLWWHTHYNFNTFWSGVDDENARRLVNANNDWLLSIVINQKGDYKCRVDTVKPIHSTIDDLTVYIGKDDRPHKRKRNFKQDIAKWVKPLYEPAEPRVWTFPGFEGYNEFSPRGGEPLGSNFPDKDYTRSKRGKGSEDSQSEKPGIIPLDYRAEEGEEFHAGMGQGGSWIFYGGHWVRKEELKQFLEESGRFE